MKSWPLLSKGKGKKEEFLTCHVGQRAHGIVILASVKSFTTRAFSDV
jgi:hypothetical protein